MKEKKDGRLGTKLDPQSTVIKEGIQPNRLTYLFCGWEAGEEEGTVHLSEEDKENPLLAHARVFSKGDFI